MASLSQALRLGDLPPPHRTFQGHATHLIEWSMMLRPNDSWGLGRHRARCLTVRLPMPPVRPVRETFASYGSRQRDIMGKVHFASSTVHSPWTALRVRWVPLYCFPTLSLRAFAMYAALPGSRAGLLPLSPLRTVRDHFQSHGSSLSFAPCGTRFHHGQISVMHLPVTGASLDCPSRA